MDEDEDEDDQKNKTKDCEQEQESALGIENAKIGKVCLRFQVEKDLKIKIIWRPISPSFSLIVVIACKRQDIVQNRTKTKFSKFKFPKLPIPSSQDRLNPICCGWVDLHSLLVFFKVAFVVDIFTTLLTLFTIGGGKDGIVNTFF